MAGKFPHCAVDQFQSGVWLSFRAAGSGAKHDLQKLRLEAQDRGLE